MSVTFYPNYIQRVGFDAAAEPTITGETFTCSGGETADPGYDLLDNRRTNVITYDSTGQTTAIVNRIDASSSHTNNFCILDNHNLNTDEAKVDLAQGGSGITLTNSYSGTLGEELSTDGISGGVSALIGEDGVTLILFGSVSDTRWDVTIDDISTHQADITLGEICFGFYKTTSTNPELQPIFGYDVPGASFRESDGGQRYGFSTYRTERRSWRMTWKYITDSEKADFEWAYLLSVGTKFPFYIDLSGPLGNTNPTLFYVRFMRPLSFTGITKDAWQVTIDIEEEI
ncbi:MAG: hypothetical protein ACW98X_25025 [Promethearchaeota archaeon]|jgi:hypothetical protein